MSLRGHSKPACSRRTLGFEGGGSLRCWHREQRGGSAPRLCVCPPGMQVQKHPQVQRACGLDGTFGILEATTLCLCHGFRGRVCDFSETPESVAASSRSLPRASCILLVWGNNRRKVTGVSCTVHVRPLPALFEPPRHAWSASLGTFIPYLVDLPGTACVRLRQVCEALSAKVTCGGVDVAEHVGCAWWDRAVSSLLVAMVERRECAWGIHADVA